jgi:putative addiction module killer protein
VTATHHANGLGNLSNAKSVGKNVLKLRIDFDLGYRVYFGRDDNELIILVGGGALKA